MALTYNPPTGQYTSRIPYGTANLRTAIAQHFGITRVEVVRDRSRCQSQRSTHCECRGIDWFPARLPNGQHDFAKGRRIFDFLVANADTLGVQGVIYTRRLWGLGAWSERRYQGPHPHDDHVHGELNIHAARSLTRATIESCFASPVPRSTNHSIVLIEESDVQSQRIEIETDPQGNGYEPSDFPSHMRVLSVVAQLPHTGDTGRYRNASAEYSVKDGRIWAEIAGMPPNATIGTTITVA